MSRRLRPGPGVGARFTVACSLVVTSRDGTIDQNKVQDVKVPAMLSISSPRHVGCESLDTSTRETILPVPLSCLSGFRGRSGAGGVETGTAAGAMTDIVVVLTTVADNDQAESLARQIVDERLAACVNLHPAMLVVLSLEGSGRARRRATAGHQDDARPPGRARGAASRAPFLRTAGVSGAASRPGRPGVLELDRRPDAPRLNAGEQDSLRSAEVWRRRTREDTRPGKPSLARKTAVGFSTALQPVPCVLHDQRQYRDEDDADGGEREVLLDQRARCRRAVPPRRTAPPMPPRRRRCRTRTRATSSVRRRPQTARTCARSGRSGRESRPCRRSARRTRARASGVRG